MAQALQSLTADGLVTGGPVRYRALPVLADALRESIERDRWLQRALEHAVTWADEHARDADAILADSALLARLAAWAKQAGCDEQALKLSRAIEQPLALGGLWERRAEMLTIYASVVSSASSLVQQALPLFLHGTQAAASGATGPATQMLNSASALYAQAGDTSGAAAAQQALHIVHTAAPSSPQTHARTPVKKHARTGGKTVTTGTAKTAAAVIAAASAVTGAAVTIHQATSHGHAAPAATASATASGAMTLGLFNLDGAWHNDNNDAIMTIDHSGGQTIFHWILLDNPNDPGLQGLGAGPRPEVCMTSTNSIRVGSVQLTCQNRSEAPGDFGINLDVPDHDHVIVPDHDNGVVNGPNGVYSFLYALGGSYTRCPSADACRPH